MPPSCRAISVHSTRVDVSGSKSRPASVVACQIRQSLRLLLAAAGVESLIRREPIIFPFDMRDIMRATVHALPILVVALWGAARPGSAQSMAGGQSSVSAMPGFGGAVAVSDGEVFVGEAGNVIVSGAVYVFHRRSGGWEEVARLRASDGVAGDGFGTAIAVDGATLLVSAAARDDGGAVYVFERSMSGDWMEVDRLSALEVDARGGYGATLALVDDIAMVGAPAMATTGAGRAESPVAGAVYVFERSGGSWSARAVLSEGDEGYTHDAQCVTYRGPDEEHQGKQICLGSNETAFSIADVTDPSNTVALSLASYPNVAYTHQGWLTEDQRYFYQGDELDEGEGRKTRTLIWDVSDLDDPQLVKEFYGTHESTDHNMYVLGNLM